MLVGLCLIGLVVLFGHNTHVCLFILLFSESDLICAATILKKYISLVCYHVSEVLQVASHTAARSQKHFVLVARIISDGVCGMNLIFSLT